MPGRKKKRLSTEDRHLWSMVTRTAIPLHVRKPAPEVEASPSKSITVKTRQHFEVSDFRIGDLAPRNPPGSQLDPSISDRLAHAPVQMDHGTHRRMVRGKLKPEARLDLHGSTLAQAHPALTRFIQGSHARGLRLVLVITGKGKDRDAPGPIPIRRGVLKHQVPGWLNMPPLGRIVLDVRESHIRHGGAGAYYVYLRRSR